VESGVFVTGNVDRRLLVASFVQDFVETVAMLENESFSLIPWNELGITFQPSTIMISFNTHELRYEGSQSRKQLQGFSHGATTIHNVARNDKSAWSVVAEKRGEAALGRRHAPLRHQGTMMPGAVELVAEVDIRHGKPVLAFMK